MECFEHANSPAVGICRVCGRGVCHGCVRDTGHGLACSDACEKEVMDGQLINLKVKRLYGVDGSRKVFPMVALMWTTFAIMFLGFSTYIWIAKGRPEWFLIVFGAVCAMLAIVSYRRARTLQLNC